MFPVLLRIGDLTLYTYGLFVALGFIAAYKFAGKRARDYKINPDTITDLFFVGIISGMIGARLFYVMINYRVYANDPVSIFKIWTGGLVYYGGFIIALVALVGFAKFKRLAIWRTADCIAPAMALGHAIGRIGCFFAGCCYGKQCDLPWAITFKNPESLAPLFVKLHPTQLYSVLSNFLLFALILWIEKKKKFDGMVFWTYILLYGLFRSLVEVFRGDQRGNFGVEFLSFSQGIGLIMALFSIFMLIYLFRLSRKTGNA